MAEQNPDPTEATPAKGEKVVKYTGSADIRDITEKHWEAIGVKQKDSQWDITNRFSLPVKDFSKDALAYFETDSEFDIVEA